MTRVINLGWMILSTPQNGLFRPAEVTGHCLINSVYCPLMELLIMPAQASGEDMILPTIQLLRVTLITWLSLLLISLLIITTLVALIALIAVPALITLKS